MRHKILIEMQISFTSKWHAGSGEGSLLVNRLIRRDARNWPFIPGSTLKGVIRESCEKLSRTLDFPEPADPHQRDLSIQDTFHPLCDLESPVDQIFGNNYETGNLFFRDARLETAPPHGYLKEQSQISIHRMLGTTKEHHLFSSEFVAPMHFSSSIEGYHRDLVFLDAGEPPYAYCLLIAGIMNLDRLGGSKSTGSGQLQVSFDSIEYNNSPLEQDSVFQYLDSELYGMTKEAS